MRKILSTLIIIFTIASCTNDKIYEDVISRHEDGNRKVTYYYKLDKDGNKIRVRETWYYMEGMKHLDGPIVNDKRNGKFETYYKSGSILSTGEFVDGVRVGKAVVYHENGNIHYEGQYENGKECGIWKFYNEDGSLYKEVNRDLR